MRSGMTARLVAFIEREAMRMQPFARVAEAAGVSTPTVRDVFAAQVERLEAAAGAARVFPRRFGLDECYVDGVARFVITYLDRRRTFEILPKKDALTVARPLIQVPHPERDAVAVIDMWKPYRELVREFLPRAVIVVDKFHVLRKANDAVMAVRRRVRDTLPAARRQYCMTNSAECKGGGKRSRFLLLKRARRLSEKEERTLREWKEEYPEIAAAYDLKEELYDIWELRGRFLAERRYDAWVRKVRASPHDLRPAFHGLLRAASTGGRRSSTTSTSRTRTGRPRRATTSSRPCSGRGAATTSRPCGRGCSTVSWSSRPSRHTRSTPVVDPPAGPG